jgi:hypothetical protein
MVKIRSRKAGYSILVYSLLRLKEVANISPSKLSASLTLMNKSYPVVGTCDLDTGGNFSYIGNFSFMQWIDIKCLAAPET